jgi:hypothetical protein
MAKFICFHFSEIGWEVNTIPKFWTLIPSLLSDNAEPFLSEMSLDVVLVEIKEGEKENSDLRYSAMPAGLLFTAPRSGPMAPIEPPVAVYRAVPPGS